VVKRLIELGFLVCAASSAAANPEKQQNLSVIEKATRLTGDQFIWAPEVAPAGPLFLVIDLTTQRALLYRNGVPIAASTISTGSKGRETPTGLFTILQKKIVHRSRTYDDAPMPYMQRLTSKGVAMHAGILPGYPASHGCIRLPKGFAKLLYGVTELGTRVKITDEAYAEYERRAAEYQRATEDVARRKAEQQAAIERKLDEFNKAKVVHEKALRKHNVEKHNSKVAAE
jgi:hypothetical protein